MIVQRVIDMLHDKVKTSGFELLIIFAIAMILGVVIFRFIKGDSKDGGTWTKKKYYEMLPLREPPTTTTHKHKHHQPPTDKKQQGADSKGEIECRRVLQRIFRKQFDKARPDFLNNPVTGGSYNLELDCYDDELKIGLEYNGRQHYEYIPFFHRTKDQFTMQKYRDDMKRRMCKDEGILLIEVPHTINVVNIESFVTDILRKKNRI
jgi:hypothetical protein